MAKHDKRKQAKMECPSRRRFEANEERFDLVGHMEAVSSTELTGLVPSAPVTDAEYESYNEIIPFSPKRVRSEE